MADETPPVGGQQSEDSPTGSRLIGWVRGHAKELGIGVAAVGVLLTLIIWRNGANQTAASAAGVGAYPGAPTPAGGGGATGTTSPDTMNMDSLNSMVQGLTSLETQNYNALQQLINKQPVSTGLQDNSGDPNRQVPGTILPVAIGTPGYSKNAYIYTTRPGDTLSSLTARAGWGSDKQKSGGPAFTYNYRNNAQIFNSLGISSSAPGSVIPTGTKVSL